MSVDSTIVRAHQHSATAKRIPREDRTVLVEDAGAVSNIVYRGGLLLAAVLLRLTDVGDTS